MVEVLLFIFVIFIFLFSMFIISSLVEQARTNRLIKKFFVTAIKSDYVIKDLSIVVRKGAITNVISLKIIVQTELGLMPNEVLFLNYTQLLVVQKMFQYFEDKVKKSIDIQEFFENHGLIKDWFNEKTMFEIADLRKKADKLFISIRKGVENVI